MLGAMRGWLRVHSANGLVVVLYLGIAIVAAQASLAAHWSYALAGISIVGLAAWVGNYRCLSQISDTPLSRIASAAQGYVEIAGRGELPDGVPLTSKLTGLPCIWYQYEVYEKIGDDPMTLQDAGSSDEPFIVSDGSGQCIVDPDGARVVCTHRKTWHEGDTQYVEWLLLPRQMIYAIGNFITVGGADASLDFSRDVSELLAEWKKDQHDLLRRFDLNGDGALDEREWGLARHQAQRVVEARHREIRMRDGTHMLCAPTDGRLSLISDSVPAKLRRSYLLWAWLHALVFVAAAGGAFLPL